MSAKEHKAQNAYLIISDSKFLDLKAIDQFQ